MFLNNTADKLVFKFLNKINYGYLELTTNDRKVLRKKYKDSPSSRSRYNK